MNKIIKKIEKKYPECTRELLDNAEKAYELFCKKQSDYGDNNIKLGLDISSSLHDKVLSQLGVVIRMNDKIQRLLNIHKKIIFEDQGESVTDESLEDTCIDLMNYSNILLVLLKGKWGK